MMFTNLNWGEISQKRADHLQTLNEIYGVRIDTVGIPSQFIMGQNVQEQLAFETSIATKELTEGIHMIYIGQKQINNGATIYSNLRSIPFWFYRD